MRPVQHCAGSSDRMSVAAPPGAARHRKDPSMTTLTTTRARSGAAADTRAFQHIGLRVLGAALALAVAYIHVKDQGGLPGDKSPGYIAVGYFALEAAGLIAAIALLAARGRRAAWAWALAVGVALGPIVGYVLSRGPGLPSYTDDKGVWTEPLGLVSLAVEGALLLVAAAMVIRSRRTNH